MFSVEVCHHHAIQSGVPRWLFFNDGISHVQPSPLELHVKRVSKRVVVTFFLHLDDRLVLLGLNSVLGVALQLIIQMVRKFQRLCDSFCNDPKPFERCVFLVRNN